VRSRPLVGAILLATTLAFIGLLAGPAGASPTTQWVSLAPVGSNTGCASPGYNSIQDAVNAASTNDTVQVCAGTYTEQVTIQTSLTLKGAGAAATRIEMPLPAADSTCNPAADVGLHTVDVVDVCGGATVKITGLTVAGPYGALDCTLQGYGIAVVGGGTATITNTTVTSIREDPLNGCQGGVGILVGRLSTGQVGTATITGVTVTDYQKGGIVVSNTGSSAKISNSTVAGVGETDQIAQNGVQISFGGSGTVNNSTITGNECDVAVCGPDPEADTQAAGVLLYDSGSGTKVQNSIIANNDMGVYNAQITGDTPMGHKTTVTKNHLSGNRYEGLELDAGKIAATSNSITGGNAGVDVLLYAGQDPQVNATVTGNTISNADDAIRVSSDNDPSDVAPKVTANGNALDASNGAGVSNPTDFVIDVKSSWWGDPSGPSDWSIGSGLSTSPNVNFFPWEGTSSLTVPATCTMTGHTITGTFLAGAILCGTGGNDFIDVSGGPVLILGNGGNDQLKGTNLSDAIIGGTGTDFIDGRGGSDSIQCRGGSDTVVPHVGDQTSNC
jgi:Right handed beta helix region